MSSLTLTLIATPDPEPADHLTAAQLRDQVVTIRQDYGELLAVARAALAAEARNMSNPLGFLHDHLAAIGALPPAGARPTDFQPADPDGGVWGRW